MQLKLWIWHIAAGCSLTLFTALAAAYAELGRFDEAIQTSQQAHQLATQKGNTEFAAALERRIASYQSRRPVRQ